MPRKFFPTGRPCQVDHPGRWRDPDLQFRLGPICWVWMLVQANNDGRATWFEDAPEDAVDRLVGSVDRFAWVDAVEVAKASGSGPKKATVLRGDAQLRGQVGHLRDLLLGRSRASSFQPTGPLRTSRPSWNTVPDTPPHTCPTRSWPKLWHRSPRECHHTCG